jgi:tripartite-type tricarboxylate transporter receptor subunit TctC
MNRFLIPAAAVLALAVPSATAGAQSAAEFFKGKTVEIRVGHGAGGGYDLYTRVLARHMAGHLQGKPTMVVKNMPGAGGLKLAGFLAQGAARDGTIFGLFDRGGVIEPLLGNKAAQFDARKFNPVGSIGKQVATCAAWHKAKVLTIDAVLKSPLLVGGTGPSATTTYPAILNAVLGTKFKIISGYKGSQEILGAMEKGEVEGVCLSWPTLKAAKPDWVRDKFLVPLIQISFARHPDLKDVPMLAEVVKDDDSRRMLTFFFAPNEFGRPYFAPPEVPADRIDALRRGFDATMKDARFLGDATKAKMEVDPITGEAMAKLIDELYATPKNLTDRVAKALEPFRGKKAKKKKK